MCEVECAPVRKVVGQQRPEQAPVRWNAQMQQFVDYHEILEFRFLLYQVRRQSDRAGSRAGTPFPRHTLHSNKSEPRPSGVATSIELVDGGGRGYLPREHIIRSMPRFL